MVVLTYVLKIVNFQTTQELVRGTSNLLLANDYWIVAFKIQVFDASLFEQTPNRSNSEI